MKHNIYSLNGGEVAENMWPRSDHVRYYVSCSRLENMLALLAGGAENRPGFEHIDTYPAGKLDRFRFSSTTAFVLAFGDHTMRFYSNGAVVKTGNEPYEEWTPWNLDETPDLRSEQVLDSVFVVHPDHPPQQLFRASDDDWTVGEFELAYPPFQDENKTATTITPSGHTGTITLEASGATFKAGHVGAYWRIGHNRDTNHTTLAITSTGVSSALLVDGDFQVSSSGSFDATIALQYSTDGGTTWLNWKTWPGNDGTTQVSFPNTVDVPTLLRVAVLDFTSATDARILLEADSPTVYGYCKIIRVRSETEALAEVIETLVGTSATTLWSEGAWSTERGFPRQVLVHNGRLLFARNVTDPIWGSRIDSYNDFRISASDPDAAVFSRPFSKTGGVINGMISRGNALIVLDDLKEWQIVNFGTPAAEYRKVSAYGSSAIGVCELNDSLLFAQRKGEIIRDFVGLDTQFDLARDPNSASNITAFASHITQGGASELFVAQQPEPTVFAIVQGQLVSALYERSEQALGWGRHITAGTVLSGTTIPGDYGDEVWVSILRGATIRIERLHPETRDAARNKRQEDCLFLDAGVVTTSPDGVVRNLGHLEGWTVGVLVDGATHRDCVVEAGEITLDGPGVKVMVGLRYQSYADPLPIVINTQQGSSRNQIGRIPEITVNLLNSSLVEYGDPERGVYYPMPGRRGSDDPNTPPPLQTGPVNVPFGGGHSRLPRISLRQIWPLPFTVLGITCDFNQTQT